MSDTSRRKTQAHSICAGLPNDNSICVKSMLLTYARLSVVCMLVTSTQSSQHCDQTAAAHQTKLCFTCVVHKCRIAKFVQYWRTNCKLYLFVTGMKRRLKATHMGMMV